MACQIQKNFLFVWILVMLAIAAVLTLTISGCSKDTTDITGGPVANAPAAVQADASGCVDSDGGKDTAVRGKVTAGNSSYMDKCADPFLVEYYCENGQAETQNFRCEKGCDSGACK